MKIGHSIIIFLYKLPYSHGMTVIAVECPVDELHLWHVPVKEEFKFCPDFFHITQSQSFVY